MYHLARKLSSQLTLVTDTTDYGSLEKCYSIWICRDDVPKNERYSISFYGMVKTKNIGRCASAKENYDLLTLVVIRLGEKAYHGEKDSEGYGLLLFLNAIMYPRRTDFMETVSEYINFFQNEELGKETNRMSGLGQSYGTFRSKKLERKAIRDGYESENRQENKPKQAWKGAV